jgi:hypothetical protein
MSSVLASTPQGYLDKAISVEDFTTMLYSDVLKNELLDKTPDYQEGLATATFDEHLLKNYKDVLKKDSQSTEVGCIDYRIFINAQETVNSFWLGKVQKRDDLYFLPVFLGLKDAPYSDKSGIELKLKAYQNTYKIVDIIDIGTKSSLDKLLGDCLSNHIN